ncbi:hypothetical protein [Kribbella sp. CA-293567]|uniref:hypothetical protein n=1 Tax=Kribbella sp. CA-293567 TaxID=3002436 RepID=UPI0022DE6B6B|nr:hypothetical protein [Kribbella sp. CA-293567]WBQ06828.1 hypothetical protein OX958_08540 [Kribbella sp. CA-293567]
MERNQPRTLLEQLFQQRDQTLADAAREFEKLAAQLGEPATMSPRHLRRWMSGQASNAYPSTRRIAHRLWGAPFEDLIGPPGELPRLFHRRSSRLYIRPWGVRPARSMAPAPYLLRSLQWQPRTQHGSYAVLGPTSVRRYWNSSMLT